MADIKQMSFLLLVLLVSVSGVYEWAKTDPTLQAELGIGAIDDLNSTTLMGFVSSIEIDVNSAVETSRRTDVLSLIGALLNIFATMFSVVMKLMFGWISLVTAIFTSVGLAGIDVIFIGPIAVIEILATLYFLRDLVNTVRGVG